MLPLDLQARMMLATGDVDNLLIGNAYASEEEFKGLQEVVQESSRLNKDHMDPTLKMLVDHGIISLEETHQAAACHPGSGSYRKRKRSTF